MDIQFLHLILLLSCTVRFQLYLVYWYILHKYPTNTWLSVGLFLPVSSKLLTNHRGVTLWNKCKIDLQWTGVIILTISFIQFDYIQLPLSKDLTQSFLGAFLCSSFKPQLVPHIIQDYPWPHLSRVHFVLDDKCGFRLLWEGTAVPWSKHYVSCSSTVAFQVLRDQNLRNIEFDWLIVYDTWHIDFY